MLVALGESYEKLERMQEAKKVSSAQRVWDLKIKSEFTLTSFITFSDCSEFSLSLKVRKRSSLGYIFGSLL